MTDRCATSSRCRQPVAFNVDGGSWRSVVCEKHAGLLLTRRLAGESALRVTPIAPTDED